MVGVGSIGLGGWGGCVIIEVEDEGQIVGD